MDVSTSPTELFDALTRLETQPALVWYSPEGRIELSGKVLANHIAKTTNYLIGDLGVDDDSSVFIDLPAHWKSVVWTVAVALAGANEVADPSSLGWSDVNVTSTPTETDAQGVAITLASLAFSFDGELPDGFDDGSAAVIGQPDALLVMPAGRDLEVPGVVLPGIEPETRAVMLVNACTSDAVGVLAQSAKNGLALVVVNSDDADVDRISSNERAHKLNSAN